MKAELGDNWEKNFSQFDKEASFAASLGQVHKAVLQNKDKVACKLQYPDMSSAVEADLSQLKIIFKIYVILLFLKRYLIDIPNEKFLNSLNNDIFWDAQLFLLQLRCNFDEEFSYNFQLSKNFIKNLTSRLLEWTGNRWIITLSKSKGDQTIYEKKNEVKKMLFEDAKKTEIYKKVMELFPNAELTNVKEAGKKEEDI